MANEIKLRKDTLLFIGKILTEAQKSAGYHTKGCAKICKKFKDDSKNFVAHLTPFMDPILLRFKKDPIVERSIKFFIRLATYRDNGDEWIEVLTSEMIHYLLSKENSKNKAVRYRVCDTIGRILRDMDENYEIDEDLWQELVKKLVRRLQDKIPQVRRAAAFAVNRLQDKDDDNDPVRKGLILMMDHDSNKDCRKSALQFLEISRPSVKSILRRCRDLSDDVRKCAFEKLHGVHLHALSIHARVNLLKSGLTDRSSIAQDACSKSLTMRWLPGVGNDIIKFLSLLDVENYENECETILRHILKENKEKGNEIVPLIVSKPPYLDKEKLTNEYCFYWRILIEFLSKHKETDQIEDCLPDTVEFVKLFESSSNSVINGSGSGSNSSDSVEINGNRRERQNNNNNNGGADKNEIDVEMSEVNESKDENSEVNNNDNNNDNNNNNNNMNEDEENDRSESINIASDPSKHFICKQLLILARYVNYADEFSRNRLSQCAKNLLIDREFSNELIPLVTKLLRKLHTDEDDYIRLLLETINEIREPLEADMNEEGVGQGNNDMNDTMDAMIEKLESLENKIEKMETKKKQLKLRRRTGVLVDSSEEEKLEEEYNDAIVEKERLEELLIFREKETISIWQKILTIVSDLLQFTNREWRHPLIQPLFNSIIVRSVCHQLEDIRASAMHAFALFCQLDKEIAQKNLLVFFQALRTDRPEIQLLSMQSMFDFLMMYDLFEDNEEKKQMENENSNGNSDGNGNNNNNNNDNNNENENENDKDSESKDEEKSNFNNKSPSRLSIASNESLDSNGKSVSASSSNYDNHPLQPKSTSELVEILKYFLECEDSSLLECSVQGFVKLLFMNRLKNYKIEILTRLFLLFFNPIMEENESVRQCLSVFFPYFADGKTFPQNRETISQCIIHCIRVCCYAPRESPLSNVSLTKLTEYILWLLNADPLTNSKFAGKQSALASDPLTIHESLAFDILFEIDCHPNKDSSVRPLARLLTILQLNSENPHNIKQYKVLANRIKGKVNDKNSIKFFDKFLGLLTKIDCKPNESLNEQVLANLEKITAEKIQEIEKEHLKYFDEEDEEELQEELDMSVENDSNSNDNDNGNRNGNCDQRDSIQDSENDNESDNDSGGKPRKRLKRKHVRSDDNTDDFELDSAVGVVNGNGGGYDFRTESTDDSLDFDGPRRNKNKNNKNKNKNKNRNKNEAVAKRKGRQKGKNKNDEIQEKKKKKQKQKQNKRNQGKEKGKSKSKSKSKEKRQQPQRRIIGSEDSDDQEEEEEDNDSDNEQEQEQVEKQRPVRRSARMKAKANNGKKGKGTAKKLSHV